MTDHHDDTTAARLFGPVTDTDRRRWQIQSHAALATVLSRAFTAQLVPLVWTLGQTGQLTGRVPTLDRTAAQIREIYTAWVDFLMLPNQREHTGGDGTHLTAIGNIPDRSGGLVRAIGITAHIYPHHDLADPAAVDPTTEEC